MTQQNQNEEIPTVYSHSVKIEQSAKGGRITVHVNANDGTTAMREAIFLYQNTKLQMQSLGEQVAPIELARERKETISKLRYEDILGMLFKDLPAVLWY